MCVFSELSPRAGGSPRPQAQIPPGSTRVLRFVGVFPERHVQLVEKLVSGEDLGFLDVPVCSLYLQTDVDG